MKRLLGLIISVLLIVIGLFILLRVANSLKPQGRGALQVTSNIKSEVFLNGKPLGNTPLCRCNERETIKEGAYDINIVPEDKTLSPFFTKVKIAQGVLTAVDRTFLPGSLASAYTLTLEKINSSSSQFFVASLPDGALVFIDGAAQAVTPFLAKNLSPSEHEVELKKAGFIKKTIKVRTVQGYKLIANVILGTDVGSTQETSLTPSPSPVSSPSLPTTVVRIKSTPTGFLRVRELPSLDAAEIAKVFPNESYPYLDEKEGWYKIKVKDGAVGWVSSKFSEKVTNP